MESALVVGLGNPGPRYAETRHNAGWLLLDELVRRRARTFTPGGETFLAATAESGSRRIHLIKPLTFMNASGEAVTEALSRYGLTAEAVIVALDDFHLPLGTIRLRESGSDGGHHGLASVIIAVGSARVRRLRLGIGPEGALLPAGGWKDFVLSPFEADEREKVGAMVDRGADAVDMILAEGMDRAMNVFNTM
jgi:PTH1 family peptidyl-tRNA hydrolase